MGSMNENRERIIQNQAIECAIGKISDTLIKKNAAYDGSAFKEILIAGQRIPAEQTILVRITDKMRRLQSSSAEFDSEDTLLDLAGYIILLKALKSYQGAKSMEVKNGSGDYESVPGVCARVGSGMAVSGGC